MNKLTKIFILVVYTIVIFSASFLIARVSSKVNRFVEYTTTPYNEDITVNTQVMEFRQSTKETNTDYEYSKYDLYLFITKLKVCTISNLYAYVGVESEESNYTYTESSSSRTMSNGTYTLSAISLSNSSTEFAYKKVEEKDGKVVETNHTPKKIYVKIAYDVQYGEKGKKENKELNYMFEYKDIDTKKFDNYEKRLVLVKESGYIDSKDDIFKIKMTHTTTDATSTKPEYDNIKLNFLEINTSKLENDETVVDSSINIYGLVGNEKNVTSKYFSKYVKLFSYNGYLNLERSIRTTRTVAIDKNYEIDKLYVTAEIKLSSGKTVKTNYFVDVKDLKNE